MKLDEFTRAFGLYPLHEQDTPRVSDQAAFEVCAFDFTLCKQPHVVLSRHATYWDALNATRHTKGPSVVRDPISEIEIRFKRQRNNELRRACDRAGISFYTMAINARTPATDPDARGKIDYGDDWEVLPR